MIFRYHDLLNYIFEESYLLVFYLLITFNSQTAYYFVLFVYADMFSIYKTT